MILKDIRTFIERKGPVSLPEVARYFDMSPDACEGLVSFWVNKSVLKVCQSPLSCASSCGGGCIQVPYYETRDD